MSGNSLVMVPIEGLSSLRDKFRVGWPKHILAFTFFENIIKSRGSNPEKDDEWKILCLNGDWSNGTFVAILQEKDIFFASLEPSYTNLKKTLQLVDYTSMRMFLCVRECYYSALYEVIESKKLHVLFDDGTTMKYITQEEAEAFTIEIPDGFQIGAVNTKNAAAINSVWPHRSEDTERSVLYVKYLIENNESIGLFNENGKLLAWCLSMTTGSLGILQVDEQHLRKGYGEIVTKAITKKIALKSEIDVTANITFSNLKSFNLFTKLGFKDIDKNFWIGVIGT